MCHSYREGTHRKFFSELTSTYHQFEDLPFELKLVDTLIVAVMAQNDYKLLRSGNANLLPDLKMKTIYNAVYL